MEIVIIGGGISAISAAMCIEKLIGPYTRVHVTLVHDSSDMLFYTLLPEVVGGDMQPGHVVNPIRRIIPQTRVLNGQLDHVDEAAKRAVISRKNGDQLVLRYDQLIVALFLEPNLDFVPGIATQAHTIDSVGDALHIRRRIFDLIQDAELAEDADERRRLLTFAVVGSGQRACASAVEICALLRTAEVSYPVLREQGWQVHLYEDTKVPFSDFEAQIQARRDRELKKAGIKLCGDDQIAGLTNRSITLTNGERRPVGMVVNAAFKWPAVRLNGQDVHWPPETGAALGLKGHEGIWVPNIKQQQGERRRFMTTADLAMLGRTVGYNAWARSQNYPPRPYRLPTRLLKPYNMGRHSLCSVFGLLVGRTPGWFLSRLSNLLVLPGLERNLRILIDWLLDIPFRNDIAVLGPDPIERLHRKHFEADEEVISEGDMGDTAYIVDEGRLAVFKGGTQIDELGEGDCFGEIALLSNVKRTATIRCLTACELMVLVRGDLRTLSTGQRALARAIRKQAEDRQRRSPARHLAIGV